MTNPWHRLQLANVAYAPWLPLRLTATEVKRVQVTGSLAFEREGRLLWCSPLGL
jgi:hypothetical protein